MADSNLYKVLSGLNTTDSLLKTKLVRLSGQVSPAFEANKIIIGAEGGLAASTYEIGTTTSGAFGAENKLATEAGAQNYVSGQLDILKNNINEIGGAILSATSTSDALTVDYTTTPHLAQFTLSTDDVTISQDANGLKSLITLKKLDTPASATFAATYELQNANGQAIGDQINIIKDQFLKTAAYDATTEELVFTFTVPSGELVTRVSAHDLVHELSGSNAISVTDVTNGQSAISLILDTTAADGKYLRITGDGLNLFGITEDIAAAEGRANAGLIALSGALKDYTGENAVSAKFAAVDGRLDDLESATTGGLSGVAANSNIIIGAGTAEQVKSSNYTLGGAAFDAEPLSSKVATEKGAADYADAVAADAIEGALSGLTNNQIVIADGTDAKKVKTTGVEIQAQGSETTVQMDPTSDAEVPTSKAVAAYVNDGLAALVTEIETLQGQISAL